MAFNGAKSADYAMEALSQGFSMLKVKEITRQSNRLPQPDPRNESDFELLGRAIINVHFIASIIREENSSLVLVFHPLLWPKFGR